MRRHPIDDSFDDRYEDRDELPREVPQQRIRRVSSAPVADRNARRGEVRYIRPTQRVVPRRGPDPRVWFIRGSIGVAALAGLWLGLQALFPVSESRVSEAPTATLSADGAATTAPDAATTAQQAPPDASAAAQPAPPEAAQPQVADQGQPARPRQPRLLPPSPRFNRPLHRRLPAPPAPVQAAAQPAPPRRCQPSRPLSPIGSGIAAAAGRCYRRCAGGCPGASDGPGRGTCTGSADHSGTADHSDSAAAAGRSRRQAHGCPDPAARECPGRRCASTAGPGSPPRALQHRRRQPHHQGGHLRSRPARRRPIRSRSRPRSRYR